MAQEQKNQEKQQSWVKKTGLDNPKVQNFLTNIYAVILINLIIWLVIRPVILDINRLKRNVREYKAIDEELTTKLNTLQQLGAQLEQKELELKRLDLLFPYDENFSYLLVTLDSIASELGVKLISVNFNKQVSSRLQKTLKDARVTTLLPITFNVTFEGDYVSMMRYVKALEETPFLPQILTLEYSARDKNNNNKRVYTITFVVYKAEKLISATGPYDSSTNK